MTQLINLSAQFVFHSRYDNNFELLLYIVIREHYVDWFLFLQRKSDRRSEINVPITNCREYFFCFHMGNSIAT